MTGPPERKSTGEVRTIKAPLAFGRECPFLMLVLFFYKEMEMLVKEYD
jgi:hypothetical protein